MLKCTSQTAIRSICDLFRPPSCSCWCCTGQPTTVHRPGRHARPQAPSAGDRPAARRLASTGRAIGRPEHALFLDQEPKLARARAVAGAVFDAARGRQGRRPASKGQAINTGRHLPRLWLERVATTTRFKVRPTVSPGKAMMSVPTCPATHSRIPYVTMEPAGFLTLPRKKTAIRGSWRSKRRSRMEGIRTSATSSAGTRRTGPGQALTPKSASLFIFLSSARYRGSRLPVGQSLPMMQPRDGDL